MYDGKEEKFLSVNDRIKEGYSRLSSVNTKTHKCNQNRLFTSQKGDDVADVNLRQSETED